MNPLRLDPTTSPAQLQLSTASLSRQSASDRDDLIYADFAAAFPSVAKPLIAAKVPPDFLRFVTRVFLNHASITNLTATEAMSDANDLMKVVGYSFQAAGTRVEAAIGLYLELLRGTEPPALSRFLIGLGKIEASIAGNFAEDIFGDFPQPIKKDGTLVDLATGFNFDPKYVCKIPSAKYIAVDRATMVEAYLHRLAEIRGAGNFTVLKQDIRSLHFAPESIDTVRCKNVQHYVPHFGKLLPDICSWIERDGRLILQMDPKIGQHAGALSELADHYQRLVLEKNWGFSYSFAAPSDTKIVFDTIVLTKPGILRTFWGGTAKIRSVDAVMDYMRELVRRVKDGE